MPPPPWMDRPIHHFILRTAVAMIVVVVTANLYLTAQPWLPSGWQINKTIGAPIRTVRSIRPTCASFATAQEAQVYFDTFNATWLDANHNGIACERLRRSVR